MEVTGEINVPFKASISDGATLEVDLSGKKDDIVHKTSWMPDNGTKTRGGRPGGNGTRSGKPPHKKPLRKELKANIKNFEPKLMKDIGDDTFLCGHPKGSGIRNSPRCMTSNFEEGMREKKDRKEL